MLKDALVTRDYALDFVGDVVWQSHLADESIEAVYLSSWRKRAMDIAGALALLAFVIPLLVFVALAIVLTSRGGLIFRQRRYGRFKVPFSIYKLRSMRTDANTCFRQAISQDARVTRIGRAIRKTSIDELPQLLNVLKGDMSLVGPRPHAVEHDNQFSPQIPGFEARYCVRPGITGLAQISGARGETPTIGHMRRRLDFDLCYIASASFMLDCIILLRTAKKLVFSPLEENVY